MFKNFEDIVFEKQKKYYFKKYDINPKVWAKNRLVPSLVLGLLLASITWYISSGGIIISFLIGVVIFFIMMKYSYINLTNMDRTVAKYLAIRLPMITTTFVALSAYYDSMVNVLEYSKLYVNDKYYSLRIDKFLASVKDDPEHIDDYIFALFSDLPSVNALFLSRAIVDLKNKGYDQELVVSLMNSVNSESESIVKMKLEAIPMEFIKFGTLPVMFTMLIMLQLVMALMAYAFI